MLKSNEILTLFALLKKAELFELKEISNCCEDEFIIRYNNPISQMKYINTINRIQRQREINMLINIQREKEKTTKI